MIANPSPYLLRMLMFSALSAMILAGCGRTALESPCEVDDDCPDGMECIDGWCAGDPDQSDVGFDADGGDELCTSDLDCGDGTCRDGDDGCVGDICNLDTGQCEEGPCEPNCGDGELQMGCQCVSEVCEVNADCGDQVCDGGQCRPCVSSADCSSDGTLVCSGGQCMPGAECLDDDDCRPYEECGPDNTCVQRPECTFNDDCGVDEQCIAGTCTYTPECESDDDCSSQAECVGGYCETAMCRGNDECLDGELCDAGECVTPPVALSCEVVTGSQTMVPNQSIYLQAFAYDAQGNGVAATFNWESSDPAVGEIVGNELQAGSMPGTTTVTAILAGGDPVACSGAPEFTNLGLATADELRVRVIHMETGQPIEDAEVFVGDTPVLTNGSGVAEFADPDPGQPYNVSVFHGDYNYLTVKGVSARDIRLPISPRSGSGPVAGFTGHFNDSAIHTDGDISLGLAGASLAGDLLDVNLERLLGDPFHTEFGIPGMGSETVPLPGGLVAHGQVFNIVIEGKQRYFAQAAGGPRLAWGLAGEIPFSDLMGIFTDPPDNFTSAIGDFLPLFSRFDHAQQPQVFQALPRVLDVNDINNNGDTSEWLPDYENFPEIDLMPSVRQQLSTHIHISSLPELGGEQSEVAVLLGGVRLEDVGLVPLGISGTTATDEDPQPESRTLYMAPPYGSAVGGRYTVMAISIGAGAGDGGFGGDFSVALWNSQSLPSSISLGTFPDSSTGAIADATRTISVDATAGPVFRVRMVGANRSWDVWSLGPDGVDGEFSHDITIPTAPVGWNDLFTGDTSILVDAVRTSVSIDDLVRSTGVGLHRAGLVTTSFNRTTFR